MKEILIKFLEWMNKTTMENPMQLETDNEDIAMMFLAENRQYGYVKRGIERKALNKEFQKKHADLIKEVWEMKSTHQQSASKQGLKLVELARNEIGYSIKTKPSQIIYFILTKYSPPTK